MPRLNPPDADHPQVAPLWPGVVVGSACFLLLLAYWVRFLRLPYFPAGDEFSLLVHSTRFFHPQPLQWFRHGFAGYFEPYPDLSLPYSNFLRPMANVTYWIESLVFGEGWSSYLLGNYLIVACLVATVWTIAWRFLRLPALVALAVTAAAAVCPAISYQAVLRPSFAFDLEGALWALLAIPSLVRRRWWLAGLFVTLALLTKETAYYAAPAAAAACFFLLRGEPLLRRSLPSLAYLLPLFCVFLLRRFDFPQGQGVYVLNETAGNSTVKRVILAGTHWPYTLPGEQHIFERSVHNLAALLLTLACWWLVGLFALRAFRARRSASPIPGAASFHRDTSVTVLFFFVGALLLPLGLDLGPRFGASVYPLFFLVLGAMMAERGSPVVRVVALVLLVTATVASGTDLARSLFGPALHREQRQWARSRNLVNLLAHERLPVVFLVADASESFSSAANVERFAGYPGTIVPISNLDVGDCPRGVLEVTPLTGNGFATHSALPASCGDNTLGATFHATPTRQSRFTRDLAEATVTYDAHNQGWSHGQFSASDLDIHILPRSKAFAVIVPQAEGSAELRRFSPRADDRATAQ